ncbi:MAG: sigma-54-dependent Fis family transcriptional regulator [Acidobacteriota bacterium]
MTTPMQAQDGVTYRSEDLAKLVDLAEDLLRLDDHERLLDAIVQRSLEVLHGDRGFLMLRSPDQGSLQLRVVRNWSREELEGDRDPISRSILQDVLHRGEPTLIEDALSDDRFSEAESVLRKGIRSVLAAPLTLEGKTAGALYLESRSLEHLFETTQLGLFHRILDLSARALEASLRRLLLEQRNQLLENDLFERHRFPGIITGDPAFLKILETVAQVAPSDLPVLVQGPTGTGKELVVRALHLNSRRASRPYVTVNCGAVSPSLLESELFGHRRGAFTGASRDKQGLIPSGDTGTVFLDEVGELPKELQVKLLRTLQFGEVQPVGASRPHRVDVRFVAATNRDLEQEVADGNFREDLLYRLNAITVELPPLHERPDDVLPLFYHFLRREAERMERPLPTVPPAVERALSTYDWPGNVRDLENEARRLVAITPEGHPIAVDSLSKRIQSAEGPLAAARLATLDEMERQLIEVHLKECGGNRSAAARSLGISREGLRKKMKRFEID